MSRKIDEEIWEIKRATKRSWLQLRRGCTDLIGESANHTTFMVGASSRAFARKVSKVTGMTYKAIIRWLDSNELGRE